MSKLNIANPGDRSWTNNTYVLCFGAYGWTHVLAYANSLDDALDECIDWLEDNEPGLIIAHEEISELINEQLAEVGRTIEEFNEAGTGGDAWASDVYYNATADLTCGGNHGVYIASYEWGIVVENPSKTQLIELYHRNANP